MTAAPSAGVRINPELEARYDADLTAVLTTAVAASSHNVSRGGNATDAMNVADETFAFALYTIVVPILFGLVTLVGTVGNGLVIYVILSRQKMRTVTNLLLLNLGFADMSFVLICVPFTAYQFAKQQFPFGDVACKLMHYLLNVTCYVTVYTLVLISVIRYLTILHNQETVRFRTKPNIVLMILLIWFVMLTVNSPICLLYGIRREHGIPDDCDLYNFKQAIAVMSLRILYYLNTQKPSSMLGKKKDNKKKQASRLIILVVVIFALFWLPVHIHLLIAYHGKLPEAKWYQAVSVLWNTLAYFNSCVNPIIYNYASQEFQTSFREVIWCCKEKQKDSKDNGVTQMTVIHKDNAHSPDCHDTQEDNKLITEEANLEPDDKA